MRYLLVSLACLLVLALPATAQDTEEEDGGFIAGLLQGALSGENRSVQVIGLEGALSSRATIRQIRISDDAGVWLTINGAELDWRRAALLRGRLEVNTLSAASIDIARPPNPTEPDPELPSPVATPFQVPELPVAVNIATLSVPALNLAEPVLGIAAELAIGGRLVLADGSLDTDLAVTRLDREGDRINLIAGFANQTRQIRLNVDIEEAAGGLLAEVLQIPGRPTVRLGIAGEGPVSDFTADIDLATAGEQRLGGQVRLSETADAAGATRFEARLSGDLRPLMAAQFHPFFGAEARFDLSGQSAANGALDLDRLTIRSEALDLRGALRIAGGGRLAAVDLDGVIAAPEQGAAIRLPLAGPVTEIARADIRAGFDAGSGNGWTLSAVVEGFRRPDLGFGRVALTGQGVLEQGAATRLDGTLDAALSELAFADAALGAALGSDLALAGGFGWSSGGVVRLDGFELRGSDYAARLTGEIDGLDSGFALTGSAALEARDLSRFAALAGRPLSGAVQAEASGNGAPLGGAFDIRLTMAAQDLGAGIAQLDPLIAGQSRLLLDMARDETGTTLRAFELESVALSAEGAGTVRDGTAELRLNARLDDLARIVPQAPGPVTLAADLTQSGDRISGAVDLKAPDDSFADLRGSLWRDGRIDGDFRAALNQVQKFVPALSGSLSAEGSARRDADRLWQFAARAGGDTGLAGLFEGRFDETGGASDLRFDASFAGLERLVPQLSGALTAKGRAERSDAARWQAEIETGGTAGLSGRFDARFDETTGAADLRLDADLARLERFVPQLAGTISARGTAARDAAIWQFDLATAGSAGISGAFAGRFDETTGAATLDVDALLSQLERVVPQLKGALAARGRAERSEQQKWSARVITEGSAGITGSFDGSFDETTGALSLFFDAALAELERLVPGLTGTLEAKGRARRDATQTWRANAVTGGDAGLSGTFRAVAEEASGDVTLYFDGAVARLQRLVPDLSGTMSAAGQAERRGEIWRIDTTATGPGGMTGDVDGSFDQARNLADITARGQVRLDLANPFLRPNSLRGTARYDLALKGAPGLSALSGSITSTGATMAIPAVAQTLTNLDIALDMANSRANVAVTGGLRAGGRFRVNGPVGLTPPFAGSLGIDLIDLVLTDNLVFTSSANGRLTVEGPLAGGAQIAGRIDFGETEIDISSASGAVGAAPIPEIRHLNESAASRITRARAGLIDTASGGGPAYGLDLTLNAPARIFARGRGLNAELGGNLTLRGTSDNVIPVGQISLIRGVFDILGRRLNLDEGAVTLQGSLEPFLFFSASTTTSEGDATLTIAGPSSAPRIEVTSVPERPSEEALALLLFGNQFNDLSPLQIAQLGAQVATLSGRGGGFLGSVRDGLGVDNLDVSTDADGRAQVGIGTYLADGVYTDVIVNAEGESEVTLNLDLTDSLTAKGSVDNQGNTGIGLFFQRDY